MMPQKIYSIFICLLSLLLTPALNGQKFEIYDVSDGLSSDYSNTIIQDRKGFIWIGTNNGLNRYNGYETTVFVSNEEDSSSISSNWITALLEDADGNLWVGTDGGGLNFYDKEKNVFENYVFDSENPNSINSNVILSLELDKQQRLWIGTNKGLNLYKTENGSFESWNNYKKCDQCYHAIKSIVSDKKGNLWIGDEIYGLYYFNVEKQVFSQPYTFKNDRLNTKLSYVNDLLYTDDKLWIATADGPFILDFASRKIDKLVVDQEEKSSILDDFIISINKDKEQNIWICSEGSGVGYLQNSQLTVFSTNVNPNIGLNSNTVADVIVDYSNNLWVATRGGGLNKYNLKTRVFDHHATRTDRNSLVNNEVRALQQEASGTVWIGTNNGVSKYDPKSDSYVNYVTDFSFKSDASAPRIRLIHKTESSGIWVGTQSGGLYKYNQALDKFQLDKTYYYNNITDNPKKIAQIIEHDNQNLWLFTDGTGVIDYDLKTGVLKPLIAKYPYGLKRLDSDPFLACLCI